MFLLHSDITPNSKITRHYGYSMEEFFRLPYYAQKSVIARYYVEHKGRKSLFNKKSVQNELSREILEQNLNKIIEREQCKKVKIKSLLRR